LRASLRLEKVVIPEGVIGNPESSDSP